MLTFDFVKRSQLLKMIWFSLLMSISIFVFLAKQRIDMSIGASPHYDGFVLQSFTAASLVLFFLANYIGSSAKKNLSNAFRARNQELYLKSNVYIIFSWVLAEVICIFAFMIAFGNSDPDFAITPYFFLASYVAMGLNHPFMKKEKAAVDLK